MDNKKKKAIVSLKVITLVVVLLFAGTLEAVGAALEPTISSSAGELRGMPALGASPGGSTAGYNVIWDNGMNYNGLGSTQNDTFGNSTWESILADDFIFTENQTVRDVHWIGGYWNPAEDGDFDWEIMFYEDNATGTKPGTVIASFYFPNAETGERFLEGDGSYLYDYSVDLLTPVEFTANTKYWISIQGIGDWETDGNGTQSGWAFHTDPILLNEAVFKSALFGYPNWTNFSVAFNTTPSDMCFQLTSAKAEAPALTPIGLLALVGILSVIAAVTIVRKRR